MSVSTVTGISTRVIQTAGLKAKSRLARKMPIASRRPQLARSLPVPGLARVVEIKIASERHEFEEAFQLLAASYRARGYEAPSTKSFRFTPYHLLPDTVTLVAQHQGRVCATLSLVPDTTLLGLPMESIYGAELAELRGQGRRLAEATSLAADQDVRPREFVPIFQALIKLAMQYHVRQGGDSWVITVNPRHRNFYQKVLGFVPLGPQRSYPTVENHPAEAYLLDLELMEVNAPTTYREVFGERLPASVLAPPDWSPDLMRYLGRASAQIDHRTLEHLLLSIEHFGSAPRWLEVGTVSRTAAAEPLPDA